MTRLNEWPSLNKDVKFDILIEAACNLNYTMMNEALEDPIFNRIELNIIASIAIRSDNRTLLHYMLKHPLCHVDDTINWNNLAELNFSQNCIKEFASISKVQIHKHGTRPRKELRK